MPYDKLSEVPKALRTAGLTLAQVNIWARYFDEARDKGSKYPGAIAWTRFKMKYKKVGDKWVAKVEKAVERFLVGWTISSLMPGKIKEDVTTLAQARALAKKDIWKINWKTGKFKERRTRGGVRRANLYATTKSSEPVEWLTHEGVIPAGSPGATKEHPGVMIIVDKGLVEYGSQKAYSHEYFYKNGKIKGRLVFRQLPRSIAPSIAKMSDEAVETYLEVNESKINKQLSQIEKDEILPEGKPLPARARTFWLCIQPINQTPYVLSKDAVEKGWIGPLGFSCLPKSVRKEIPVSHQYWKAKDIKEAKRLRDEIVKYSLLKMAGKGKFTIQEQTWRGPISIRFGPTTKEYHFNCDVGEEKLFHFVLERDPLVNESVTAIWEPHKYKEDMSLGLREKVDIRPKTRLNPSKNTPSMIIVTDEGECRILEDSSEFKKVEVKGKKLKGLFTFKKEDPRMNMWLFERSATPTTKSLDLYVPIAKYDKKKGIVYGVVLEPDVVDLQGDSETAEEIERAAHKFLIESRKIDINHWFISKDCYVVESYIAPIDFNWENQKVRKGSWILGTLIKSKALRDKIESGELTGYSIKGSAFRAEA